LAFAKSLVTDQAWFEELWQQRHVLSDKPSLLLWGMKDPVVKPHNLLKFQEGFGQAKTVQFETAGHFPQEEQAEKMVEALLNFMQSD
jgi:pimeloyl-ACP methyl ester carboxylesterase